MTLNFNTKLSIPGNKTLNIEYTDKQNVG